MTTKFPPNFENLQLELRDTLQRLRCLEVVAMSTRHGDMRFLCKSYDEAKWFRVLSSFMAQEGNWYSFIGKKYFMNNGKLVYGWVLIFEADDLETTISEVRKLFSVVGEEENINELPEEETTVEVALPWETSYWRDKKEARVRTLS